MKGRIEELVLRWNEELDRRDQRLSHLRGAVFAVFFALTLFLAIRGSAASWGAAGAGLGAFVFLVCRQDRVRGLRKRNLGYLELNRLRESKAKREWVNLPALPSVPDEAGLPRYFRDLDLLGPFSLLRLINLTFSTDGFASLIELFRSNGVSADEIDVRTELVSELERRSVIRKRILLHAHLLAGERIDSALLRATLQEPVHGPGAGRWLAALALIQAIALPLLLAWVFLGAPPVFLGAWGLALLIHRGGSARFHHSFDRALALEMSLEKFGRIVGVLERASFPPASPLGRLLACFSGDGRPSRELKRVGFWLALLSFRGNPLLHFFLNLLVPWDFFVSMRLERSRLRIAEMIPSWLQAVARLESALSLAEFADVFSREVVRAERVAGSESPVYLKGKEVSHPLIPPARRVGNPIEVTRDVSCVLITGSNMSGKSTYLRTVGLNLLLMKAGAPVFAESFEARGLDIYSCLRISDSVEDAVSSFYAEVKELAVILRAAEQRGSRPLLYLIDEIFRGTNNRERLIGARAYIRAILKTDAVGLVATHDLELAALESEQKTLRNFHFRETIEGDRMKFTYRMHPGPCPSTNALKIMEMSGLPI